MADVDIRALLMKYRVRPSKKYGQSFLKSPRVARDIVSAADLTENDTILEVGGGLGILTEELAQVAGQVYVIEIEHGLANALRDLLRKYDNLKVIEGDALSVDFPKVDKVVSNLPYSISSEITFRLLRELSFDYAILMFQREFAQRLLASPGTQDYSRLTVNVQYQAEVELLMEVPAQMFYPIPAVDSTVVKMKHKANGPRAKADLVFFWMINGIFSYPNKNLRRALSIWLRNLGAEKSLADKIIMKCEGNPKGESRLRTLSLEELTRLADIVLEFINKGHLPDPRGE